MELVRRGLSTTRAEAQAAIEAGLVTVDGAPADKASRQVADSSAVHVLAPARRFVSRGGDKLAHALVRFGLRVHGLRCLDAGISTGGFTDVLLQAGAREVVGIDVGYGQVAERIRTDPRVEVRERTNVRHLVPDALAAVDLVVGDLSFISLWLVLPALRSVAKPLAPAVLLVKPQFEATPDDVGRGGIVKDPEVWRRVLCDVAESASRVGWSLAAVTASPITGTSGNVEFLVHLAAETAGSSHGSWAGMIDAAVQEGRDLRDDS